METHQRTGNFTLRKMSFDKLSKARAAGASSSSADGTGFKRTDGAFQMRRFDFL
jgi:hypothetical protein